MRRTRDEYRARGMLRRGYDTIDFKNNRHRMFSCHFAFVTRDPKRIRPKTTEKLASTAAPAVCRAGLFQFASRQQFTNRQVQSRALFWCKSGSGEFVVNDVRYKLEPHDVCILPWNRHITYLPSQRDPMYTAHVHLVPWYRPGSAWVPNVPHESDEPEFNSPDRRDVRGPLKDAVVRLHTSSDDLLGRLIDCAIRWYLETDRNEQEARALGVLLFQEIARTSRVTVAPVSNRPEELRRLLVHVDKGYQLAPSISDLATIIGRSRSHVLKLFRHHMGQSAKAYIIGRQMKEARELLLSTTLPISEVGKAVGLPDPYHFSKLFRRHVGLAPREYRNDHGPFSTPPKPSNHTRTPPARS
ncbi:MAG: AraC family transcriptional regulator [Opitutus sp.]